MYELERGCRRFIGQDRRENSHPMAKKNHRRADVSVYGLLREFCRPLYGYFYEYEGTFYIHITAAL